MKKIIFLVVLVIMSSLVFADYGDMMGYGMMGGIGTFGMSLIGVLYFALISFIFSAIFWGTHNWLVKGKKGKR